VAADPPESRQKLVLLMQHVGPFERHYWRWNSPYLAVTMCMQLSHVVQAKHHDVGGSSFDQTINTVGSAKASGNSLVATCLHSEGYAKVIVSSGENTSFAGI